MSVPPGYAALLSAVGVSAVVVASLALTATWERSINAYTLTAYWAATGSGGLGLTLLWLTLRRRGENPLAPSAACDRDARPDGGAFARHAALVLLVAAAARCVVAVAGPPFLSDDIWRYIHDGATLGLAGENPYASSPAETDPTFRGNNPELVTIYQPASQWVFAGLARLAALPHGLAADAVFRLGFSVFDLVAVALLLAALRRAGRSAWWAALYAWHPLAITEVAGAGHQDPLGIALLLASLLAADGVRDGPDPRRGARLLAAAGCGAAMAAAVAVKPVVGPIAVFVLVAWRRRLGPGAVAPAGVAAAAGAAVLAAMYAPFALMPGGMERMIETTRVFTAHWRFNGSLHPLLEWVTSSKPAVDAVLGAALLATIGAVAWKVHNLWRAAGAFLVAALLMTSTVHPWYLLWPLALVPMSRGVAAWVFALAATAAYAAWLGGEAYGVPPWLRVVEYAPVYAAVAWSARRELRGT